ncbi:hypothetical protein ACQKM1_22345 [Peribacillus frigoritolerans]|uniref:phage scaffolding protein n=1 Tax=Peribacillus frigoritolerans TaxID=450367 RepID=UPI003D02CF79
MMLIIKKKLPLLKLDLQTFAGDPPPTDPPATPPADPPAPKTYDEDYVKGLRDEAAKYRKKAKELETNSTTQQQDLINKVFTAFGINPDPNVEFEKQLSTAQQQAQAAEKRANDRLIQAEIKAIGTGLNLVDLDAVDKLVDKSSFSVKEDGSVEGVKEALEKLAADKPYLVSVPGEPKPNGYVPGAQQRGNDPKPEDAYTRAKERFKDLKERKQIRL